jgi:hypothetical protein
MAASAIYVLREDGISLLANCATAMAMLTYATRIMVIVTIAKILQVVHIARLASKVITEIRDSAGILRADRALAQKQKALVIHSLTIVSCPPLLTMFYAIVTLDIPDQDAIVAQTTISAHRTSAEESADLATVLAMLISLNQATAIRSVVNVYDVYITQKDSIVMNVHLDFMVMPSDRIAYVRILSN